MPLFLMGLVLVGIRDAHLQQIPIAISSDFNNVTDSWLDPCHLQNTTLSGQCTMYSIKFVKKVNQM